MNAQPGADGPQDALRSDLQRAADRMPSRARTARDIGALEAALWPGETVHAIVVGTYQLGGGLLVATDRRLLFAFDGAPAQECADFPYSTITEVTWRQGAFTGALSLHTREATVEVAHLERKTGKELAGYVRTRLGEAASADVPRPPTESATTMEQLNWLVQMHETGVLSDAEFAAAKARLLDI